MDSLSDLQTLVQAAHRALRSDNTEVAVELEDRTDFKDIVVFEFALQSEGRGCW
jgi:hypothetical protein